MAVQSTDNRFNWCHELLEACQNFTPEECCVTLKNELSKLKGADPDYVATVRARPVSEFPMRLLFYPVYEVSATATYTWDETKYKKETTEVKVSGEILSSFVDTNKKVTTTYKEQISFDKTYFRNIYKELEPDNYVGRSDQRFYELDHVDDLEGGIYNDSCVYSQSDITDAIQRDAKSEHNGTPYINQWYCTACMIPLIEISVLYNGTKHRWYFNAHNGAMFCEGYLVSKKIANAAKETAKAIVVPHILTYIAGVSSIIVSFANMNWEHWFASLLSLATSLIGGIIVMIKAGAQNETNLRAEFGQNGDLSEETQKNAITYLIVACVILVFAGFCAIVW